MEPQISREWSTPRGLIACGWLLAAAAMLWLVFSDTLVDRLYVGVLVLVLVATASYATVVRPRLRADPEGVTVRGPSRTRQWSWSEVEVRLRRGRRLGRDVETLELEGPREDLVILGRLDLGADPRDVAEALDSLRT